MDTDRQNFISRRIFLPIVKSVKSAFKLQNTAARERKGPLVFSVFPLG